MVHRFPRMSKLFNVLNLYALPWLVNNHIFWRANDTAPSPRRAQHFAKLLLFDLGVTRFLLDFPPLFRSKVFLGSTYFQGLKSSNKREGPQPELRLAYAGSQWIQSVFAGDTTFRVRRLAGEMAC